MSLGLFPAVYVESIQCRGYSMILYRDCFSDGTYRTKFGHPYVWFCMCSVCSGQLSNISTPDGTSFRLYPDEFLSRKMAVLSESDAIQPRVLFVELIWGW